MAALRAQGKANSVSAPFETARCAALLRDTGQPAREDFTGMGVLEIPRA